MNNKVYINNKIFKEDKISFKTIGVYSYLCSYINSNNINSLSLNKIFKELNINREEFEKNVNALKNKGYIKIMEDWTKPNKFIYRILV